MKIENKMSSTVYSQLKLSLSHFGLCPNDWKMEPQSNDYILIKNKSEDTFYFIGKTKLEKETDRRVWQFITLASL